MSILQKAFTFLKGKKGDDAPETTGQELSIFDEYNATRKVPPSAPPCLAPWTSLNFNIDGYANVCCLNKKTSVSVAGKSITEIWNSEPFKQLRDSISARNLEHDCSICLTQLQAKNFLGVKSTSYDVFYPYDAGFPQVMEFCLENTCNLACTMCNSLLSSTIRKKQNLPPLETFYNDKFVEDLDPFIPHLKEAIFSGGEPFLMPIYYKIWEKMTALNPEITISVVTNGTTLNSRIKDILEKGRFKVNVSIDSVDKKTYESIRVNSDLDTVMQNLDWFIDYGKRKNLPVNIPICPLTLNWHTIPETIRFANEKNVFINFVYVDRPFSLTLTHSPSKYLSEIISSYTNEKFEEVSHSSKNNITRFKGLMDDISKWRDINLSRQETPVETDIMKMWHEKIMNCQEPEIVDRADVKEEMLSKMKEILSEIPPEKQPMLLNMVSSFTVARLYQFFEGKKAHEVAVLFNEFAGS